MLLQAGAVADDDGGAVIGLGLPQGTQRLRLIGAHGHLRHIHIAVLHQDAAQILLCHLLAAGGKFGGGTGGRGLGCLSAGVGVHLGVQYQQVHVTVLRHHMVDAAEADVIRPAVAAHSPDRLLGQIGSALKDVFHVLRLLGLFQRGQQRVCDGAGALVLIPPVLVGLHSLCGNTRGLDGVQTEQQLLTDGVLRVEEAVGKLGVVLKQGVLPRGAVTLAVLAIGQDGCAAADGGGAARGVAHIHVVAEQLAQQLDICRLRAAGTGGGELEVGLGELGTLHALVADDILLQVLLVHSHMIEQRLLGLHLLEGSHGQRALGGTGCQAHAAAQAIVGGHLHPEGIRRSVLAQTLGGRGDKSGGHLCLFLLGQQHRADGRVGTAHGAAVALDAGRGVPLGYGGGHTALGIGGGAVLPRAVQHAVLLEHGHGQLVALLPIHGQHDVADKGRGADLGGRCVLRVRPRRGNVHLHGGVYAHIHGFVVQIHDLLPGLLEIGGVVVLLHIRHSHIHGDDLGQGEERALQDIVGVLAQADLRRQLRRVNDIELRVLPRQIPLHLGGEVLLQLLRRPRAVQQERAAVLQILGQVVLLDICRRMAGHKVGGGH